MIQTIIINLVYLIIIISLIITIGFYRYIRTSKLYKTQKQSHYYQISILLGSGGHTGQLSLMLKNINFNQLNQLNVLITSTDKSSKNYFENLLKQQFNSHLKNKVSYFDISRTNQVKQNYITAIFTTLKSTLNSIQLIRNHLLKTTHFISNGPGTCVPFFFLFFILNKFKLATTKLIFIESWCRVDSISLSGKIVRFFTDKFIVHWQEQKVKYPWTDYYGKIL